MDVSQKIARSTVGFIKRHSALILTCVSATGVVVTAVLTAQATPKAIRLLKEAEAEKGGELTKTECVKAAWKPYIPAAAVGVTTILCIFGSNYMSRRQSAAMAATYALLGKSYSEYKNKVCELYGQEAHEKVMEALAMERARDVDIWAATATIDAYNGFADADEEERLFYNAVTKTYFQSTISRVLQAEYHLNRNFVLEGAVSLNDFCEFLGIKPVKHGDDLGWNCYNDILWIDFGHTKTVLDDGLECYIIDVAFEPMPNYLEG